MTERLLDGNIRQQVQELFADLTNPIQVLFFGSETGCEYCDETLELIREVAELSESIHLSVHDLDKDAELAQQYRVDKAPVLVIAGLDGDQILDYGVRFAGIPAGHEFSSLIHVLRMVSGRDSTLQAQTRQALQELKEPVHLQVFITPT
jgi:glutaredoxin-like protein